MKKEIDLDKIYNFTIYLINTEYVTHNSIARAIRSSSPSRIRYCTFGINVAKRIMKTYTNNYILWCKKNNHDVESWLTKYIKTLYNQQ